MRRSLRFIRDGGRSAGVPAPSHSAVREPDPKRNALKRAPVLRVLGKGQPKPVDSVEEMLSSALLAQDKQLAGIVREVDEILKNLKPDSPETQAVSNALQRTVLCAMKQSLLERELRSLALTDDLTCLYNRRAFLALATQQVKLTLRKGEGLSVFFADVDGLKQINDSLGHREGDAALVRVADALARTFRDSDIIARLGGDEFAVLTPETSRENQQAILRRLEESLQKANAEETRYQLSLSVGVARLDPKTFVSVGDLLEQADQAMYQEKRKKWLNRDFERPKFERSLQAIAELEHPAS